MNLFFQHIQQHNARREPGTIVLVGAGKCHELAELRRLSPQRLLLIEAHPQQAEELRCRLHADAGEEVLSVAAVAKPATTSRLFQLNNLSESSIHSPANGLTEHFPNVRPTGELVVPAKDLASILRGMDVDPSRHNVLLFDAPGQVLELLKETPAQLLQAFPTIVVRAGIVPLYDGDAGAEEIQAVLFQLGFDASGEDEDALYPHFHAWFTRNDDRIELQRLEQLMHEKEEEAAAQLLEAVAQREHLAGALATQQQQCDHLQSTVRALQGELNEVKEHLAGAVAGNAELAAARDALQVQCQLSQAEGTAHQQAAEELRAQHEAAAAQLAHSLQDAAEWKRRFEDLEQQTRQTLQAQAELQGQHTHALSEIAELRQAADANGQRIATLENSLAERDQQRLNDQTAIAQLGATVEAQSTSLNEAQAKAHQLTEELATRGAELAAVREAASREAASLRALLDEKTLLAGTREQSLAALQAQFDLQRQECRQLKERLAQQEQTLTDNAQALQLHQQNLRHQEASSGEIAVRQQRLQDELLKAEGQIDLIKDLLLHELGG